MRRAASLFFIFVLLLPFIALSEENMWIVSDEYEETWRDQARYVMRSMTVEEKVYQLFFVSPEQLTGEKRTTEIADPKAFSRRPVGGVILFGQNIVSEAQVKALTEALLENALFNDLFPPMIAVDEEGGSVSRIAAKLGYPMEKSAEEMGKTGDAATALEAGKRIGQYLLPLGIHADFAPVADVLIEDNAELDGRAYGKDASLVSDMAFSMASGLRQAGVIPCYKHFPGHGALSGNTHTGTASSRRTKEEMAETEWVPYVTAIENDMEMIMISHLTARGLGDDQPASLSRLVIEETLRKSLGYDGVVITDALRMSAVTEHYKAGTAALMAFEAGADFLLLPSDLDAAAKSILSAVQSGRISMERLNESVERILALKIQYGIIQ